MIIKKIEIAGFGKLENFNVNFEEGVQVIYGPNEFGKSTLMNFIKTMFYSRCAGGKFGSKDKEFRGKYSPWSGKKIGGAIEFIHNGNLYLVQKELGIKSSVHDKVLVQNLSTGKTLELGKKQEVGEYFFGIDIKSFERSSYIGSVGKLDFVPSKNSKDGIADKILSNLCDTGEDDVSASTAINNINEAIKDLQWLRGNGGKIYSIKSKINEINQKISDLELTEKNNLKSEEILYKTKELIDERKNLILKVENFKNTKNLRIAEDIRTLVKEKKDILSKVPFAEDEDVISELEIKMKNLKNLSLKLSEINNLISNFKKDFSDISDEEMKKLNQLIEEKEKLEIKVRNLNKIVTNMDLNEDFYKNNMDNALFEQCFKPYKSFKIGTKEAEEKINNAKIFLLNNEKKFNKLKFATVYRLTSLVTLIASLIFFVFDVYGILSKSFSVNQICFASSAFVCFLTLFLMTLFKNKKINAYKSEYDSKISEINELENLKIDFENKIKNFESNFSKKTNEAELLLSEKNKIIENMITEKNCSSIGEYFVNYEKSKSRKNLQNSYKMHSDEFYLKQNELVEKILKCSNLKINTFCFEEIEKAFENILFLNKKLKLIEEKIENKSEFLGIDLSYEKSLDEYIKKFNHENCDCNISEEEADTIKKRIDYLNSLDLEEKCIEAQKSIKNTSESKEDLQKALNEQKVRLKKTEAYHSSLKIAKEVMEESLNELRKTFNPKLNSRASEIFKFLTENKYNNIHISKEYDIFIHHETQDYICENFSSGTIDQAYFSLRMAISELILENNSLPIILDDAFRQYDSKRLEKVIDFLINYKPGLSQSIIFTCHEDVVKVAKIKGANIVSVG